MAKILVVDDLQEMRLQLCSLLVSQGYEVIDAGSSEAAKRLLQNQKFDLIITDALMSDSDSINLIREARRSDPAAKTLAISGGSDEVPALWSLKMMQMFGVDLLLYRPFSSNELLDAITRLLSVTSC